MSTVLGTIPPPDEEEERGLDGYCRVRVPFDWLKEGARVEIDVPRTLGCLPCRGAGCDLCSQRGGFTIRGPHDLGEVLLMTLPAREGRVTIRIRNHGGLPQEDSTCIKRGHLLLLFEPSATSSSFVKRLYDEDVDIESGIFEVFDTAGASSPASSSNPPSSPRAMAAVREDTSASSPPAPAPPSLESTSKEEHSGERVRPSAQEDLEPCSSRDEHEEASPSGREPGAELPVTPKGSSLPPPDEG